MQLIIREYLSMLRESEELDVLIPDLLLSMEIHPISKPKRGVRQFGVDLAAVGIDPADQVKKVFLFVIKQKDIDRTAWDATSQSVYQTLNEIKDFYLPSVLESSLKGLPKKIVVATNGNLHQNVQTNWKGYVDRFSRPGDVEFDFWGGDKIALLVQENMLNEFIFPEPVSKNMRRTLVFLEETDYELEHFYELVENLLFSAPLTREKEQLKALRCLHLCLNIVFHWSDEAGNLKHAWKAGERVVLRVWDWLRVNSLFEKGKMVVEFLKMYDTRLQICGRYYQIIKPFCSVKDGLSRNAPSEIELPLLTFEQIGMLASFGLDLLEKASGMPRGKERSDTLRSADDVAQSLSDLIENNKSSLNPLYDGHITDICLALLCLYRTDRAQSALDWIYGLFVYLQYGYHMFKTFPLLSDSYDDLIDLVLNNETKEPDSSTLLPTLLEWTVVINSPQIFEFAKEGIEQSFDKVNLQIWYPDEHIEGHLYQENALYETGTMRHTIHLPESFEEYRSEILVEYENEEKPAAFSFHQHEFFSGAMIAFRHFRTPVFPFFWREFIKRRVEASQNAQ